MSSTATRRDGATTGRAERSPLVSAAWGGLAAGLALFTAIVVSLRVGDVVQLLASAGVGLLWVSLFHLVPIAASTVGWYAVLAPVERPALRTVAVARWIAESVNQLLPALHVGGNVVRARRLARAGVPGPLAGASVIVDITLHLFGQMLFTLLGLSLLLAGTGGARIDGSVAAGLVLSALGAAGFYIMQRRGLFGTVAARLRGVLRSAEWSSVLDDAGAIDGWIRRLYRHRRAIALAEVWHVLSWVLGAGETFLALAFLGHPVDLRTAVVIESLGEAIRTTAFPIPAALGVQEAGLVVLGGLFGLTPDVAVALSLAKRVRELGLGIPGLVVWQAERPATALVRRWAARE